MDPRHPPQGPGPGLRLLYPDLSAAERTTYANAIVALADYPCQHRDRGGTVYFALKSQDTEGNWSSLSNNTFWPRWDVYLPLVLREDGLGQQEAKEEYFGR